MDQGSLLYVTLVLAAALVGAVGGLIALPRKLRKVSADTDKVKADADSGSLTARAALTAADDGRFNLLWARLDAVEKKASDAVDRADSAERKYTRLLSHVTLLEGLMRAGGVTVPARPVDSV